MAIHFGNFKDVEGEMLTIQARIWDLEREQKETKEVVISKYEASEAFSNLLDDKYDKSLSETF